jgi:hypothetical protein
VVALAQAIEGINFNVLVGVFTLVSSLLKVLNCSVTFLGFILFGTLPALSRFFLTFILVSFCDHFTPEETDSSAEESLSVIVV